ncbi:MAG: ABC transporter permease [Cocleimonas sp.]
MEHSILTIPISSLLLILIPVFVVIFIQYRWSLSYKESIYAVLRMLTQLILIGYLLGYIFNSDSFLLVLLIVLIMISLSSWIALRTIIHQRKQQYFYVLISIIIGGSPILILVTQFVLDISPWYKPQIVIPLAGMIYSNCINSISLAAERFYQEIQHNDKQSARNIAFKTSMIPATNTFFAVGLVALPGMMTGQILSGVDPLIAVRYQIVVMAMIFGAEGISSAIYLSLTYRSKDLI